jgi:hypothetical protein
MATLRDGGVDSNDRRVLEGEALFLRVLLASSAGEATLAEATAPEYRTKPYPDGGRWRGAIPKRLAGRGIVGALVADDGRLESHRSPRVSRRAGVALVWRILDADAARQRLRDLTALLGRPPRPRQPTLFDDVPDDAAE